MFKFDYDGCQMYFVGLNRVVIEKYTNGGDTFIKIFNGLNKDDPIPTVIIRCKEYEIIDKSKDLEIKEYLNGIE